MTQNTMEEKLESFDSFFSGLPMKDEKNCMKLYEKYVRKLILSEKQISYQEGFKAGEETEWKRSQIKIGGDLSIKQSEEEIKENK